MSRLLVFSLVLLLNMSVFAHAPATTPSHDVLMIAKPSADALQALGNRFGHVLYDHATGDVRIEADADDRAWLSQQRLDWHVDEEATAALHLSLQPLESLRSIPGYACYRTVEETSDTVGQLVASYPLLASAVDIGESWRRTQSPSQGYELVVLKLTNSAISGEKPKLFAMSSVHAREYTPAELMTRYAEELLAGYGIDANATWLLDHMEFHFLLQANPDGRKRAEAGSSWRKNENTNFCGTGSRPGIDLNRNYPVFWNYNNGGSSTTACSETYRGPSAASEPETQAVTQYVRSIFPDTRPGDPENVSTPADPDTKGLFLDIHSYSQLVLWPWGHATTPSGNADALATLGMRMAWFNNYEPQQAVGLYATRGTTDDFGYGEMGIPSYTIELGVAFFENCNSFQNTTAPLNLAALRYASRTLYAPYKLPAGPDAVDVAVNQSLVSAGDPVLLTARIDDTRYRDQQSPTNAPSSPRPRHTIVGARYYINQLPWVVGAVGTEMIATDGNFNSSNEQVHATLDTTGLPAGKHLIYVQGRDAANEYGPPSAVFLEIEPAPALAQLIGRITNTVDGEGIDGAQVSVGSYDTLSVDGDYALNVKPGTVDISVTADGFLPSTTRSATLAAGETEVVDFQLVPESDILFANNFETPTP